jgi:hypothetical protein
MQGWVGLELSTVSLDRTFKQGILGVSTRQLKQDKPDTEAPHKQIVL